MYKDLYEEIQQPCGFVTVFLDDEVVSEGSCFTVAPDGSVITAAHVVTGRWPIKVEDNADPRVRIFIKFPQKPLLKYKVAVGVFQVEAPVFKEGIQLDIAVLVPVDAKEAQPFEYLSVNVRKTSLGLGQKVFLAGYSDDLCLPFGLERIVDPAVEGVPEFLAAMQTGYIADMMGPLVKSAYVGNLRRIVASNAKTKIEVDTFYLDCGIDCGASGGPVVDEAGEVLGVIIQRGVTDAGQRDYPNLRVPSGSTLCLSLKPLSVIAIEVPPS